MREWEFHLMKKKYLKRFRKNKRDHQLKKSNTELKLLKHFIPKQELQVWKSLAWKRLQPWLETYIKIQLNLNSKLSTWQTKKFKSVLEKSMEEKLSLKVLDSRKMLKKRKWYLKNMMKSYSLQELNCSKMNLDEQFRSS